MKKGNKSSFLAVKRFYSLDRANLGCIFENIEGKFDLLDYKGNIIFASRISDNNKGKYVCTVEWNNIELDFLLNETSPCFKVVLEEEGIQNIVSGLNVKQILNSNTLMPNFKIYLDFSLYTGGELDFDFEKFSQILLSFSPKLNVARSQKHL